MTREALEDLYKKLIIPESKNPYHFQKKDGNHILAYNPICGDKFKLFLDGAMYFHGHGCALSKASGSLMMRIMENQSPDKCRELAIQFIQTVQNGKSDVLSDPALKALVDLKNHDGREDCILLTWKALLENIDSHKPS